MDPNANVAEQWAIVNGGRHEDVDRLHELRQEYYEWVGNGGFRATEYMPMDREVHAFTRAARLAGHEH